MYRLAQFSRNRSQAPSEPVASAFPGWADAWGKRQMPGKRRGTQIQGCIWGGMWGGLGLGTGWGGWTQLPPPTLLLETPTVLPPTGLCSQGGQWVALPRKREASRVSAWLTLWVWSLGPSSPKPGGGTGWAVPSQQPVTQEETASGPQTVKCQLQISGTRLA